MLQPKKDLKFKSGNRISPLKLLYDRSRVCILGRQRMLFSSFPRKWLIERSSETSEDNREISNGIWPENTELERLRRVKFLKLPNSEGIWEKLKWLSARFNLLRLGRKNRVLLERKWPISQLEVRSRPTTWLVFLSHSTPSQVQQCLSSCQLAVLG